MSKSFMYDLFFGNLVPWERGRTQDPAYTPIIRQISDIKEHFQERLSPEEYEKLEEMEDLHAQSGAIEDVDIFEYGFCMGALMMMEVSRFQDGRLTEREGG